MNNKRPERSKYNLAALIAIKTQEIGLADPKLDEKLATALQDVMIVHDGDDGYFLDRELILDQHLDYLQWLIPTGDPCRFLVDRARAPEHYLGRLEIVELELLGEPAPETPPVSPACGD